MGSEDFTIELWFRGNGKIPTTYAAFVSKWNTTGNQREWLLQYDPITQMLILWVSITGTDYTSTYYSIYPVTPLV